VQARAPCVGRQRGGHPADGRRADGGIAPARQDYERAFEHRRQAALGLVASRHARDSAAERRQVADYRAAQIEMDDARARAARLVERSGGEKDFSDTNYIFLSFVTRYLPVGIVGLTIAVIFAATMSASAGEINSLATVSVVDIYRRHFHRSGTDHHYLMASRWATRPSSTLISSRRPLMETSKSSRAFNTSVLAWMRASLTTLSASRFASFSRSGSLPHAWARYAAPYAAACGT